MNKEGPPVKAVPEVVRHRPTPQSSPVKTAPACKQGRAPTPPEGTPLQQTPTWLGSPRDQPAEVNETEVEKREPAMHGLRVDERSLPNW